MSTSDTEVLSSLPKEPAWPRGNYLLDLKPPCRQDYYYCCRVRAGVPNIYPRFYLGTLDSVDYWVTSAGVHTIYLETQLITFKSNTIRFHYPSNTNKHPNIHHNTPIFVQNHININIPAIHISHRITSTSLSELSRQTASLSRRPARSRHIQARARLIPTYHQGNVRCHI